MSRNVIDTLNQLIICAREENRLLIDGLWEESQEYRQKYDELFRQLMGMRLDEGNRDQLSTLIELHDSNMQLASKMMNEAATKLDEMSNTKKISGYSPLGASHKPAPRFVDREG